MMIKFYRHYFIYKHDLFALLIDVEVTIDKWSFKFKGAFLLL